MKTVAELHGKWRVRGAALIVAVVTLAACSGGSSESSSKTVGEGGLPSMVPQSIRTSGELRIGSDLTVPPFAFYDADHKVVGIDASICGEVATHLGLKAKYVDIAFDGIIPALQAHKFDVTCSGMFIKPERTKVINFVPYLQTGISIMVREGNPKNVTALESLCGLNVAVTVGSSELQLAKDESTGCTKNGKQALNVSTYPGYVDAIKNILTGRADAVLGDDPALAYNSTKTSGTAIAAAGINTVLDGIGVNKDDPQLAGAITAALYTMAQDGTYQAALKKWGIEADGVATF